MSYLSFFIYNCKKFTNLYGYNFLHNLFLRLRLNCIFFYFNCNCKIVIVSCLLIVFFSWILLTGGRSMIHELIGKKDKLYIYIYIYIYIYTCVCINTYIYIEKIYRFFNLLLTLLSIEVVDNLA